MSKRGVWLPPGLYESLPLLYVGVAAVCLVLAKVLLQPLLLVFGVAAAGHALLVLVARHRRRAGRSFLQPMEDDLCLPSLESRLRSEDAIATLKVSARGARRRTTGEVRDFSDTWFVMQK